MSILVDTGPTTLTETWYVDGTPTDVGSVTIGIVDAAGAVIVASGTSTTTVGSGVYTYALAVQADVKILTVTWTAGGQSVVDSLEVVGGWLFTEAELRALYASDLANQATYPDARLAEARDRLADEFEHICAVSFIPRYRRQRLPGSGGYRLEVDRPKIRQVFTASVGGVAQTVGDLEPDPLLPVIYHTSSVWTAATVTDPLNVTVAYEHGYPTAPPDIKRAALMLARYQLTRDVTGAGVPAQASSWSDETGRYTAFGENDRTGRWYGLPFVDSTLRRYSLRVPIA